MLIGASTPCDSAAWVPSWAPPSSSSAPLAAHTPALPISSHAVSLDILTTLTVSGYRRSHEASLGPTVLRTLSDGSQITKDFKDQVRLSQVWMLVYGLMLAFFFRTTCLAISYTFRSKVKNKTLFYLLLASQLLGLVSFVGNVVVGFDESANCTFYGRARNTLAHLSCACLITGILGVKAYRCLGDAFIVVVALFLLRGSMLGLLGAEIAWYQSQRADSGLCAEGFKTTVLPTVVVLQTLETIFLCGCFLFAVWRATHTPADQARISIRVSAPDVECSTAHTTTESNKGARSRRGWWDYVPESQRDSFTHGEPMVMRSTFRTICDKIRRAFHRDVTPPSVASNEKFRASVRFPDNLGRIHLGAPASSTSALNQFINHVPRMIIFRQMLRNELLYTTFLAVIFLILAISMLVGIQKRMLIGADGWIILNWLLVSVFTVHSFDRVVRRHEHEALLKHPSTWDASHRAELEASKALREKRARRPASTISVVSEWRPQPRDSRNNSSESFRTDSDSSFVVSGRPPQLAPIPVHATLTHSASSTSLYAPHPSPRSLWDTGSTIVPPYEGDCSSGGHGPTSDSHCDISPPPTPRDPPWRRRSFSEVQSIVARSDSDRSQKDTYDRS
ncbi:hypothetical protein B0H21DRAFT_741818 [Amylocystis lapponica]|nr:hypothetical protein B0H21DRAFT_741818 [Amylocystis lapponica]